MQLQVIVDKLKRRSAPPASLSEDNAIGIVLKGTRFIGEEVKNVPSPALGKWYKDADNGFYWGGGLLVENAGNPLPPKPFSKVAGLPEGTLANASLGIDISHHNTNIDWGSIGDSGAGFAYIKVSEGIGAVDPAAAQHAINAKNTGLQVGYYHFGRPGIRSGLSLTQSAIAEADNVLLLASKLTPATLPMMLDLENTDGWDSSLNKNDYCTWVEIFLAYIFQQTGKLPIIYSYKSYLDKKLPKGHTLGKYPLWIANYSVNNCNGVQCPVGWQDWAMWQFTEKGGIARNPHMDLNIKKS